MIIFLGHVYYPGKADNTAPLSMGKEYLCSATDIICVLNHVISDEPKVGSGFSIEDVAKEFSDRLYNFPK